MSRAVVVLGVYLRFFSRQPRLRSILKSEMDSKCCSTCAHTPSLSCFLKNASANPDSRIFVTCISCRDRSKKRRALQPPDPNAPAKRATTRPARAGTDVERSIPPPKPSHLLPQPASPLPLPLQPEPRQLAPPPFETPQVPPHPPAQPQATGFLPAAQWGYIQRFNAAMGEVRMETCLRCQERWFAMDLKDGSCHACFLRDKRDQSPSLMSVENEMDPGNIPAHLPELTQVEEMIIARSHVQMMVHRYRGHQYHYSGQCVSFMQNTVKTVDVLPNLPAELDIVVLRPSDRVVKDDPRYQRQFRSDFRVRKGRVMTWLGF